jgi:mono/diheme cytochrome c family protein
MNRTFALAGFAALVAVGAVAGISALTTGAPAPGQLLAYEDAAVIALGHAVYAENCAACHGARLEGAPDWRTPDTDGFLPAPPHDPTGHTWHHPDAQLMQIVSLGTAAVVGRGYQSRMPGFGAVLSEAEIAASLAYIKSTWPRHIIETHNEVNARSVVR